MDYKEKLNFYLENYTSGGITSGKFEDKLEIYKLLCFLTFQFRRKNLSNISCKEMLEKILNRKLNEEVSLDSYYIGISIVCDDLLYSIESIENPGYKTSLELINRLKTLLNEWLPF